VKETRSRLLVLLSAAHSLNHAFFWVASPILSIIAIDLATSNTVLGLVGFAGSFIYGLGSIIAGSLSDRTSEIQLIMISTGLAGLSTVMFLFAQNIILYTTFFISMGIWTGLYHPAANSLISKEFSGTTGEAMGLHGAGGTIGIVFTPVLSLAVGLIFGWRISFVVFGVFAVATAMLVWKSRFRQERNATKYRFRDVFNIPSLRLLLLFNFTIGLYMKGVELYLPLYLARGPLNFLGDEGAKSWAAVSTTTMLLCGALGQWLGGRQTDVLGPRKVLIATSSLVLLSFILLVFTPLSLWFVAVAAFAILYGIAFYGHQPAFNSLAGFLTPKNRRGIVYGVLFFVSFGMGSISQAITGYLSDNMGITSAFYVLTFFAAAALLLSFFISSAKETSTQFKTEYETEEP